jgi:hypothetical protein
MTRHEVETLLRHAVAQLLEHDWQLLEYDVDERAVVAKLACYLARLFPEYHVDVEYNRHGLTRKQLGLPSACRGGGTKLIVPDLIVHSRGSDDANLLVLEVKKETNREPRTCDRAKIAGMKHHYGYTWGLLLELPAGTGARDRPPDLEWVPTTDHLTP